MRWIFSLVTVLLISCNNSDSFHSKIKNDSLLMKWRQDSFACLGFRKDSVFKILFERYGLKNKTADEIKKILGTPNEEASSEKYLIYYSEAACDSNKIDFKSYKCWYTILLIDTSGKEENSFGKACD